METVREYEEFPGRMFYQKKCLPGVAPLLGDGLPQGTVIASVSGTQIYSTSAFGEMLTLERGTLSSAGMIRVTIDIISDGDLLPAVTGDDFIVNSGQINMDGGTGWNRHAS